jgi:hypothetical protein
VTIMVSCSQPGQREVRVWGDRVCSRQRANGASAWTKTEEVVLGDSIHDVAVGWAQVHGVRTVESGPKVQMPDREAIAVGDHRKSLGPS